MVSPGTPSSSFTSGSCDESADARVLMQCLKARQGLIDWFRQQALPRWSREGADPRGGFHERFNEQGLPLDEAHRTRVTARQIYVFTVAERLDPPWPDADGLIRHGLDFLQHRLTLPDGLFAASWSWPQHADTRFDLYEQAFGLFALARAARRSPAHEAAGFERRARTVLNRLMHDFAHPGSGFQESRPPAVPLRSNPHMHLLEACMAWSEAAHDPAPWLELTQDLIALCLTRFIDPDTGALREVFALDWTAWSDAQGQVIEPGHQFEWAWLLMRDGPWPRSRAALQAAERLLDLGESRGVCAQRGVAINSLDTRLMPRDAHAKLWPQTERIKAWCARATLAADDPARQRAWQGLTSAIDGLTPYLQHPVAGLWRESLSPQGHPDLAPCRASSLYHLVCAIETLMDTPLPETLS